MNVRAVSLTLLLLLWIGVAFAKADPEVLPMPWSLASPLWSELTSGELLFHIMKTLTRVILAFAFAMSIGLALGILMGMRPEIDRWLDPWLVVFLNLPALVLIVLCYLWIGLNETAAIAAVTLNKIPNVAIVIREGARAVDPNLNAMAQVFRMPRLTRLHHIILPQIAPYIAAAARSGVAVIWKIVLVVEFLGRSNGVGFKIHLYFQLFEVPYVLVYSLSFIAIMLAVEWSLLQPWERRVSRWRSA